MNGPRHRRGPRHFGPTHPPIEILGHAAYHCTCCGITTSGELLCGNCGIPRSDTDRKLRSPKPPKWKKRTLAHAKRDAAVVEPQAAPAPGLVVAEDPRRRRG